MKMVILDDDEHPSYLKLLRSEAKSLSNSTKLNQLHDGAPHLSELGVIRNMLSILVSFLKCIIKFNDILLLFLFINKEIEFIGFSSHF